MKPMKIVIVDDEKRVRGTLVNVLKIHAPDVIVVGEAEDVASAVEVINAHKPDVVLLDIKMPGGTGFDLLKKLMPLTFKVIFITAHDEFAIQAFKFSAIDYLLKPVVPSELVDALNRFELQSGNDAENSKYEVLLNNLTKENKRLVLNSQDKIHFVYSNEIINCDADGNYTTFFLTNKRKVTVSKLLKEYETLLLPFGFFRSHNSHLVNLSFVDHIEKDNGLLIMKDGSKVPVSERKYAEMVAVLSRI
jgi:two-component system LytT family response regulator